MITNLIVLIVLVNGCQYDISSIKLDVLSIVLDCGASTFATGSNNMLVDILR
jgi:hypothetical protein